jgi:GDP-D-mannose 3',5'-epimerase
MRHNLPETGGLGKPCFTFTNPRFSVLQLNSCNPRRLLQTARMQHTKRIVEKDAPMKKDDLIVITGAGGFIGGNLARYFNKKGFTNIRAVDKKPLYEWYLHVPGVQNLCLDVSLEDNCQRVCEGATEVYNLAADMGGMGFIERFRVECLRSILINTHMIEAAYKAGTRRFFYSSSACAYNTLLQKDPKVRALKESDAYPAMAERGYGWEKLVSEMFCEEYWHERGMKTAIARFHNVYGPHGTWDGGREKAPAAMCRKVIEAIDKKDLSINIWGNGEQTRSFMYIDDCVKGIDMITHCDDLIATPINLGSSELVSINTLVSKVEKIAGVKMKRSYNLNAPQGVAGRNSDNTFIKQVLKWEPGTTLNKGLAETYAWIQTQYEARKAGKRVGIG